MDVFNEEGRSRIMSKISGRDTRPEKTVRRPLHAMGHRFRLHDPDLPRKPDIVMTRHGKVVQVHGCFWHGHPGCKRATKPQINAEFWGKKIAANRARDLRTERQLRRWGWSVMVIWECQTRDAERLERRLCRFMKY